MEEATDVSNDVALDDNLVECGHCGGQRHQGKRVCKWCGIDVKKGKRIVHLDWESGVSAGVGYVVVLPLLLLAACAAAAMLVVGFMSYMGYMDGMSFRDFMDFMGGMGK